MCKGNKAAVQFLLSVPWYLARTQMQAIACKAFAGQPSIFIACAGGQDSSAMLELIKAPAFLSVAPSATHQAFSDYLTWPEDARYKRKCVVNGATVLGHMRMLTQLPAL